MLCEEEIAEDDGIHKEANDVLPATGATIELSRHSVAGISSPKTLKLRGIIHGVPVVVLVDSGATHCFISQKLVTQIKVPVLQSNFQVTIGNGENVKGGGICLAVLL